MQNSSSINKNSHKLSKPVSHKKILFLSSVGGILEFYDFVVYIVFSQLIAENFFPNSDKLASLMSAYAIFALGYLVRPVGGIIFSHFGDKYGRKKTFIVSVLMMAIPTFCIGLLPTYQSIGIWASVLLLLLRIAQGISVGGEVPGALTFVSEHIPKRFSGFASGVILASLNLGTLFGFAVYICLLQLLTEQQMAAFGWRVPFLLGGTLGLLSFYLRKQMAETPAFIAMQKMDIKLKVPFLDAVKNYWPQIIQGVSVVISGAVSVNLLFLYMPSYLATVLGYSNNSANISSLIGLFFYSIFMVIAGVLTDKFGCKRFLLCGALGLIIFSYPLFIGLVSKNMTILVASAILTVFLASFTMTFSSILTNLYPSKIRYTGIAVSYNIAFAFFGGLTAFISTFIIQKTGVVIAPSYYLIFASLLTVIGVVSLIFTEQKDKGFGQSVSSEKA